MTTCLSPRDHHRLQSLWRDAGEQPEAFDLPVLLQRVSDLVACDYSSVSEIDERHGVAVSHYLPARATEHADYRAFAWHVHEHPMLRAVRTTGDGGPRRLSDLVSRSTWHRLGVYGEYFRLMQIEHQVAFTAGEPTAATATAVVFNRNAPDFDDRDLAVLGAVRPLFQLVHHLSVERRRATAAEMAVRRPGLGVTVLGPVGHLESMDDISREATRVAFGACGQAGDLAPAALLRWVAGTAPTLSATAGGVSVLAHRGPPIADRRTILFEVLSRPPEVHLTARERQVLAHVAAGFDNRAVARRLGVSIRTVEKHLENAYGKLGVDNRTAAARAVIGAAPEARDGLVR